MTHEQSETVQLPGSGKWVNVYGKETPQAGQRLPGDVEHNSMEEAVRVARQRSAAMDDTQDASGEYAASREVRATEAGANDMTAWLSKQPKEKEQPPAAGIEAEDLNPLDDPFPTDRPAPAEESTMGRVLRSAGEVPKSIALGMDSAVRHATDWAVKPLVDWLNTNVANLEVPVENPQTTTGKITKSLSEFVTGFIPALKGMKWMGVTNKIAAPLGAAAIADFAVRDPHEARLSNLWQEMGLPKNVLTDYLAADPKDGAIEGRLKSAAESVLTGAALEGLIVGARALRAAKWIGKAQNTELQNLKAQYGELDEATFNKALGDPSKPMLVTRVEPVPPAVAKIREGLQATGDTAEVTAAASKTQRLYHGTIADFDDYTANGLGPHFGTAAQASKRAQVLTESRGAARPDLPSAPNVRPVDVVIENPLRLNDGPGGDGGFAGLDLDDTMFLLYELKRVNVVDDSFFKSWRTRLNNEGMDANEEFFAAAKEKITGKGYDSIVYKNAVEGEGDSFIVLNTKNIRNAMEAAPLKASGIPVEQVAEGLKINWARVDTAQDVQVLMGDMATKFKGSIDEARRGVMSQETTSKLADDLGMTVTELLARRKGMPLNAEQSLAARRLWAASGENLLELAGRAAGTNAGALDQYAFRKALATHHAIQADVIGARTETARALAAWRIPAGGGGVERARAIQQTLETMGGKSASQEIARRLSILAQHGNPGSLAKFAEKGWGAKTFDSVREVWVNGLLWSPQTHFVNTVSNTAVMFSQVLERGVAARIGQLRGATGEAVAPGEALVMTYALVSGVRDAWRVAGKAFKSGETGWALNKVELPRAHAITSETFGMASETGLGRTVDFLGQTARVPGRFLGAEDEFFKSIGYRMELHAQSLRQATSEGLTGEAMGRRMAELVKNPTEQLRIASADAALYNTFTQQAGAFGQTFMKLREKVPAITFVLPFVRTPVNIARYTFERSPFAPLVGQWRDDIAAGGARADIALARMATGSTIMLSALDWADSGLIVGKLPKEAGEREALSRQGAQDYSIKLGDKWYSFNRLDPFGSLLGFSSDLAAIARRSEMNEDDMDEWQEVVAAGITAVAQVAINKQYLRGLSDVFEVMGDPGRYSEGYINNLLASFLPFNALAGNIARTADPIQREASNPWEALQAKMIGLSDKLPPRLTLWGEEISTESGLGKTYDFFSPVRARGVKPEAIDTEIMRLAPLAAADNVSGSAPRRIGKRTSFMGVQINFKEWKDAYVDYVKLAGNDFKAPAWNMGAKDMLNAVVKNKHPLSVVYNGSSDERKVLFINTIVSQYRAQAQQVVMADPKHAAFAEYVNQTKAERREALLPPAAR